MPFQAGRHLRCACRSRGLLLCPLSRRAACAGPAGALGRRTLVWPALLLASQSWSGLSEVCLCHSGHRNTAEERRSVSCLLAGDSCDSVAAFAMRLFSGLQLRHAVRSGATTRCPLHALLLRPASDPAAELPGAQRPVGPELGQPGEQRHQQHRCAHPQRPAPAAPVPAAGVSRRSHGPSAVGAALFSVQHSVFRASCASGVSRPWVRRALVGVSCLSTPSGSLPSALDCWVSCLLTW